MVKSHELVDNVKEIINPKFIYFYSQQNDWTFGKRIFILQNKLIVFEKQDNHSIEAWDLYTNKRSFSIPISFKLLGIIEKDICYLSIKRDFINKENMLLFNMLNYEEKESRQYRLNSLSFYPEYVYQIKDNILAFVNQDKFYSFNLSNGKEGSTFNYNIHKRITKLSLNYDRNKMHKVERIIGKETKIEKINDKYLLISNYIPTIFNTETMQMQTYYYPKVNFPTRKGAVLHPTLYYIDMVEGTLYEKFPQNKNRNNIKLLSVSFFDSDWIFELFNFRVLKYLSQREDEVYSVVKYKNGELIFVSILWYIKIYNGRNGNLYQTIITPGIKENYICNNFFIFRDLTGIGKYKIRFEDNTTNKDNTVNTSYSLTNLCVIV